jgi:uncharacterized protein involved in response to NO
LIDSQVNNWGGKELINQNRLASMTCLWVLGVLAVPIAETISLADDLAITMEEERP